MRLSGKILVAFALMALLKPAETQAQWLKVDRWEFGFSGGFGGLHTWFKPSFDIHKGRNTLRLAPGPWHMSAGIQRKIGWFQPKRRDDRQILLSFNYHNDWLLANIPRGEYKKDHQVYQLMPGIHVNLNHTGVWYFQVSGGLQYTHERLRSWENREIFSARDYFSPMGELRIGGKFLHRKQHVQKFPHYHKKKPVKKIKKRKLEFKD